MRIFCSEFGRWAGATGNLGPQRDSERKISLREWTAFLGAHLLEVGTSREDKSMTATGSSAPSIMRSSSRLPSRAPSQAPSTTVSRAPSAVGIGVIQLMEKETGVAMSHVTTALNALDNQQDNVVQQGDHNLIMKAHESHRHSLKSVRQSARVLIKRPVRRLTIWEAKRAFMVAVSRPHPPEMVSNKLFLKFSSWDDSKKKRHDDRQASDAGLNAKAWVEALCTVARYQQPCPYLSLDEALEYFLEKNLGGKSHTVVEEMDKTGGSAIEE